VASIKERSPEVHLFIEMPLDAVDVNVHPTKAEVRFREQSLVHEVVRRALTDALGRSGAPALTLSPPDSSAGLNFSSGVPAAMSGLAPGETMPIPGVLAGGSYPSRWRQERGGASGPWHEAAGTAPGTRHSAPGTDGVFSPLMPLGQFRDTFIVAVDTDGIAIIDQHVAHERVLYERTLERLTKGRLESQRLLVPMIVEMASGTRDALLGRVADLDRLGFVVEDFGGSALRVSAAPALLGAEDAASTLKALGEDLEGVDRGSPAEAALKQMAATIACHAAVKANYPLTYEKMVHILSELAATSYSTICPHGRPVMLRLTRREVERNFERI
jgi:DNA mismatch repair protein MutL